MTAVLQRISLVLVALSTTGLGSSCRDARSDDGPDAQDAGVAYQPAALCEREGDDDVRALFCAAEAPGISGISSLREALELTSANMLAHSTGLGGRMVSSINPRILMYRGDLESGFVALAFTRGQQRVELIAQDHVTDQLRLYLLEFSQACNEAESGCLPGDLFTPAVEEDWQALVLRDDEDLKNTPLDCRRCHGGGQSQQATPMLLMREFDVPWMHWFERFSVVRNDYLKAKETVEHPGTYSTEAYAGYVLLDVLDNSRGLQNVLVGGEQARGYPKQPLIFPSVDIGNETMQYFGPPGVFPGAGIDDPELSRSPTWQVLYNAFLNGEAPAPPYHHDRITEPAKLAAMSAAYQRFIAGELAAEDLPDISDVLPDDPHRLAEMGFTVEPDSDGRSLLNQACLPCHNDTLDPTLSRARFDAALDGASRNQLELAIHRLGLAEDDPLRMPPTEARTLDPESRERLIDYLRSTAAALR